MLILIDGNNVGIASAFASSSLRAGDGRPTGATFGFLRTVRKIINDTLTLHPEQEISTVCLWDEKPSWRHLAFPEYKVSRKEKKADPEVERILEDYLKQVGTIRRTLDTLGIPNLSAPQQEADDLAGWFATQYTKSGGIHQDMILVSGDEDWLQLITPRISVWQNAKDRMVTSSNFSDYYGANSDTEFVMMKAITGDSGDDVPGVKGIGAKLALQFLRGEMKPGKRFDAIKAWIEDTETGFNRSLALVDLRNRELDTATFKLSSAEFNPEAIFAACTELDFGSIIADFKGWVQPFFLCAPNRRLVKSPLLETPVVATPVAA